jgi:hypothetical protein
MLPPWIAGGRIAEFGETLTPALSLKGRGRKASSILSNNAERSPLPYGERVRVRGKPPH